jgi:hypothetical protein
MMVWATLVVPHLVSLAMRRAVSNARALLHACCSLAFLYSWLVESRRKRGSTRALPSREVRSGAVGHVARRSLP